MKATTSALHEDPTIQAKALLGIPGVLVVFSVTLSVLRLGVLGSGVTMFFFAALGFKVF